MSDHYYEPKSRVGRVLSRLTAPPLASVVLALDYAGSVFDRSIPLLDRWNLVSTAVRLLASISADNTLLDVDRRLEEKLRNSGLCERFEKDLGLRVCTGDPLGRMVELVNAVEDGSVPVTDRLVENLAQAVTVILAPALDRIPFRGLLNVRLRGEVEEG